MDWTKLNPLPVDSGAGEDFKSRADKLAAKIATINKDRNSHDKAKADLRDAPIDELDFDAVRKVGRQEISLLKRELSIREECGALAKDYFTELQGMQSIAHEELEKAQKSVRAKLKRAGYHDVDVGEINPAKITPGMINAHPDVLKTAGRLQELGSFPSSAKTHLHANREATAAVMHRLTQIRESLLGARETALRRGA